MSEYMEIERRFIISERSVRPWRDCEHRSSITQHYLDSALFTNRENQLIYAGNLMLIEMNDEEKSLFEKTDEWTSRIRFTPESVFLTLKGKRTHSAAIELEWELDRELGENIIGSKPHPSVSKTRYHWKGKDGMVWEVDEFEENLEGLILAEIELPSIEHEPNLPEWLGEEITGLHQWSNVSLAMNGIE